MDNYKKIYVAGHLGMVGSAIARQLIEAGHPTDRLITRTRLQLDLTNQSAVHSFFASEKPDEVYLAAARVGGIHANNTSPADFIFDNLMIQTNVIDAAFRHGVRRLLFLGSSCIYPRLAIQPMREDALLSGSLEPTNEPYAIAKIAGIKLCESYNRQYGKSHGIDYRSVMPTNLYGPNDNYHPVDSHVIPALIHRFHEAKSNQQSSVMIWGSGSPRREFLHVDDMAAASIYVMNLPKLIIDQNTNPMKSHINVGCGADISIFDVATIIANIVGFKGKITFDKSKPDGAPRKLLDVSLLSRLGWRPKVELTAGLRATYEDFLATRASENKEKCNDRKK